MKVLKKKAHTVNKKCYIETVLSEWNLKKNSFFSIVSNVLKQYKQQ